MNSGLKKIQREAEGIVDGSFGPTLDPAERSERVQAEVERLIIRAVNEYVEKASDLKYSATRQTRRITKALQLIDIPRNEFTARCELDRKKGEHGPSIGSPRTKEAEHLVLDNRGLLVHCGLNVFIMSDESGAFVSTPRDGEDPHIVALASVHARLDSDLYKSLEEVDAKSVN